ncbi:hypothetical protein J6590_008846 [Homalodisca vitripennis]|nr:hypothetical protein J6590_008846 [Homalodisca vitripennis]
MFSHSIDRSMGADLARRDSTRLGGGGGSGGGRGGEGRHGGQPGAGRIKSHKDQDILRSDHSQVRDFQSRRERETKIRISCSDHSQVRDFQIRRERERASKLTTRQLNNNVVNEIEERHSRGLATSAPSVCRGIIKSSIEHNLI